MFPITQIGKAYSKFTFNKLAAIRPPRSSNIGIKDTIKIIISAGIMLVKLCVIAATIVSAKINLPYSNVCLEPVYIKIISKIKIKVKIEK